MWTIKKQPTNKQSEQSKSNKNRLTDIENRLVVAKGEGAWERDGLGVWD